MIFVPPLFSVYQPLKLCLLREASGRAVSFCLVVVRLQLNLSHGSEVGVFRYGEILLQFGAVDLAVDGLLLKRIGVVGRAVPRGDDIHGMPLEFSRGRFVVDCGETE